MGRTMPRAPDVSCASCGERVPLDRDACAYCSTPLEGYWYYDAQGLRRAVVYSADGRDYVFFNGASVPLDDPSPLPPELRRAIAARPNEAERRFAAEKKPAAQVASVAVPDNAVAGPDGFICARVDRHCAFHIRLNEHLREQAKHPDTAAAIARVAVKALRKEVAAKELVELVIAIIGRLDWLVERLRRREGAEVWYRRLEAILDGLYRAKLPFASGDLSRIMQAYKGAAPVRYLAPIGLVVEHFRRHGLAPGLASAVRCFRDDYKAAVHGDYGQGEFQLALQRLNLLLWHDEWDALEPDACWSEEVRQSFRAMTGERQGKWRALLHHLRGDAGSKPPKPWAKEGEARLAAVGIEDFRATLAAWFRPFRSDRMLRLSPVGSHVLKGLLWYAALARDAAVNEAALAVLDAPFKPKRNLDKVMVALAFLIDTLAPEEAWQMLLRLEGWWGTGQGQIAKIVVKVGLSCGVSQESLDELQLPKSPASPAPSPERVQEFLATIRALQDLSRRPSAEEFLTAVRTLRGDRSWGAVR
jgi:hypothetical protein